MRSEARDSLSTATHAVLLGAVWLILLLLPRASGSAPFTIQGPGVQASDFRITVFATNLYFPLGMVQATDGSLFLAVSQGTSFWNSAGQIVRLTDTNRDGIADGPPTVLYSPLPGGLTALRKWGNLLFATGQGVGKPIWILRFGATPGSPLTIAGRINFNYPSGSWEHPHSALGVRTTPGHPESCDLLFQLGSDQNFAPTTRTATLSNTNVPGATGTLQGESIYLLTLTDHLTNVVASGLTRLAKGLRNSSGFAFHPSSGDLYFNDNGIDGLVDVNEPLSADELNMIPAGQVGNGAVPDFGFPTNYTAYRSGAIVGGAGVQPLVAFQPLPDPFTGSESEGPNDIAFAPPGFPAGLNNGIFLGFHGKFSLGGIANEENPLVYLDLTTTNYFQFIGNNEPTIGHLDGLLATDDSLFVADLTSTGDTGSGGNAGVIYQIKSLVQPVLSFELKGGSLELRWSVGTLEQAGDLAGPWTAVLDAQSPQSVAITPGTRQSFYRTSH
jgi:hypothetical protein